MSKHVDGRDLLCKEHWTTAMPVERIENVLVVVLECTE
jgi:hypothetical protein